jgi:hyperosmotically inducible periplasmic protein
MKRQKLLGWLGAAAMAMTVACSQSDPGITTAVKAKMAADDTVKAYQINVDTKDRVVTLRGDVDSEAGRTKAVQIARTTVGVRDVVDSLTVVVPVPTTGAMDNTADKARDAGNAVVDAASDAGITTAVKTKMLADTLVSGLKIDVDTTDGVVTISGNVASAAEKRRAAEIARETNGVKSVKDQLKIVKP